MLGSSCKKVLAEKGGRKIELYVTSEYGVNFHSNVNIEGIALMIIEDDSRFEKDIYEATSVIVKDLPDDFFKISDYRSTGKIRTQPKHHLTGRKARPLKVKSLGDEEVELSFDDGRIHVLNFWFKGCKPCIKEIPVLNKVVDSLASDSVKFIAISIDETSVAKSFLQKREFAYDQYADGGSAAGKYGITSYPTHVIINKNGKVHYASDGLSAVSIQNIVSIVNYLKTKDD